MSVLVNIWLGSIQGVHLRSFFLDFYSSHHNSRGMPSGSIACVKYDDALLSRQYLSRLGKSRYAHTRAKLLTAAWVISWVQYLFIMLICEIFRRKFHTCSNIHLFELQSLPTRGRPGLLCCRKDRHLFSQKRYLISWLVLFISRILGISVYFSTVEGSFLLRLLRQYLYIYIMARWTRL